MNKTQDAGEGQDLINLGKVCKVPKKKLDAILSNESDVFDKIIDIIWYDPDISGRCKILGYSKNHLSNYLKSVKKIEIVENIEQVPEIAKEEINVLFTLDNIKPNIKDTIKSYSVHFNAKVINTKAKNGGILISKNNICDSEYLCCSSLLANDFRVCLDNTKNNDFSGSLMRLYQRTEDEQKKLNLPDDLLFEINKAINQCIEEDMEVGCEKNLDRIDPRLRQLICPHDGFHEKYCVLTPLACTGIAVAINQEIRRIRNHPTDANIETHNVVRGWQVKDFPIGGSNFQNATINNEIRRPFVYGVPSLRNEESRVFRLFKKDKKDTYYFGIDNKLLRDYENKKKNIEKSDNSFFKYSSIATQEIERDMVYPLISKYIKTALKLSDQVSLLYNEGVLNNYVDENGEWKHEFLATRNVIDTAIITRVWDREAKKEISKQFVYELSEKTSYNFSKADRERLEKVVPMLVEKIL